MIRRPSSDTSLAMSFDGLSSDIFDTYSPDKWSSMVHNLERMKTKESVIALCEVVQSNLAAELESLARGSSDEIPNITNQKKVDAQWVYWFRNPKAREDLSSFLKTTKLDQASIFTMAAHEKHAVLCLRVQQDSIFVGVYVAKGASVDRKNLQHKLDKSWDREVFVELIQSLPENFEIGFAGQARFKTEVDDAWMQSQIPLLETHDEPWQIGVRVPADDAVGLGADLAQTLQQYLSQAIKAYQFINWTRDNDHIEATKQIQAEKVAKRQQATSYKEGDKVRIINGLFKGKNGIVEGTDTKANVKVRVGKMTVKVSGHDLIPGH